MKYFFSKLFRFLLGLLIPFLILLGTYCYFDPFKVLYNYDSYSNSPVSLNRDYISTETFLRNNKKYHYNSFIFGSSRTMAYRPGSWIKHLSTGATPFSFDAYSETIFGMLIKLKLLDETNNKIDNALLIICRDQNFAYPGNQRGHLFMKDPNTSHEGWLKFEMESFKSYLKPSFLFDYYYYKITNKYEGFMWGNIEEIPVTYDKQTNAVEEVFDKEKQIQINPELYYLDRTEEFYKRTGERTDQIERINGGYIYMLKEIARILQKHHTNYKVVISPLYEQMKFSKHDITILKATFGDHLYDFSGKNYFTDSKYNYFESSHYRPVVGDSIMNIIYKNLGTSNNIIQVPTTERQSGAKIR